MGVVSLGVINPEKEVYKFTYPGQVHALDAALSLSGAPPKQAWRKAKRKVKETVAEVALVDRGNTSHRRRRRRMLSATCVS